MAEGLPLQFSGVSKSYGSVLAVNNFTATILPGKVTAFLGPNGAGKTTTLRILLGLVAASEGSALVGNTPYKDLASPLTTVGAALEATSFHPGRSARNHLSVYARAARIPLERVDTVLDLVGLNDSAEQRVGGYSLGMRQRLGLAGALLGDPSVVVLDEPVNGLDPEGIKWIRGLLRHLADEGRTVLISSHLLSEVQQTVDEVLVIRRGELVFTGSLFNLEERNESWVTVDTPDRRRLKDALVAEGLVVHQGRQGLVVSDTDTARVGRIAFLNAIELHALQRHSTDLEDTFLKLIREEGS
ncbi:ATP-binding cassette domain-containing protein [Lysinibacter sp. HNR]|uniref:ATP-binding cassette domain-containing protein n=1 Tax=Lysinibacter sp. HNR TaxID=3031408 RepID=UPI0024357446|nr:ATP-binding cassette domain-containing protein [Lysinibacter sp. HNR]WGD37657.1 ATP-binding cassette domain-containing protein [Lysinibacter sp. HNR]